MQENGEMEMAERLQGLQEELEERDSKVKAFRARLRLSHQPQQASQQAGSSCQRDLSAVSDNSWVHP